MRKGIDFQRRSEGGGSSAVRSAAGVGRRVGGEGEEFEDFRGVRKLW